VRRHGDCALAGVGLRVGVERLAVVQLDPVMSNRDGAGVQVHVGQAQGDDLTAA
jgi:hypothetical protein